MSGSLLYFNVHDGFLEAIVRGLRSGFLSDSEYRHLTQCTEIGDLKLNFTETDYGQAFRNTMDSKELVAECKRKLASEFEFMRAQSASELTTFLDFITHEYMIKNIALLIKDRMKAVPNTKAIIEEKCNPLGYFKEIESIALYDQETGIGELYRTVLVDTPLAPYFEQIMSPDSHEEKDQPFSQIQRLVQEVDIDIVCNLLRKAWLESFYEFCMGLGGVTGEFMCELLEFEADAMAISITYNSMNKMSRDERKSMFPNFGKLYPQGMEMLYNASDYNQIGSALQSYQGYRDIWNAVESGESLDNALFHRLVTLNKLAFDSQSHYACFFAYVRLKEQECRNLYWIWECIVQRKFTEINKIIRIF